MSILRDWVMYSHERNNKDDELHEYGCSKSRATHIVEKSSKDSICLIGKRDCFQSINCACDIKEIQNEERDESRPER